MGEAKKRAGKACEKDDGFGWAGPGRATYDDDRSATLGRLYEEVGHRLSGKRLDHSRRVAETARRMALRFGVDPFLAEAAGILHDWDKKLPPEELWAKARRYGIVDEGADPRMEPLLHAWTAGASLPERFGELPAEVFRAVGRHTVGAPDMSDLDMIVYLADALEPGRDYAGVDRLRSLVGTASLPELFARGVRESISSLLARGRYLDPAAVEVWNACCSLCCDGK